MSCNEGSPINFEFSSADASTSAPLVLRDAGGTTHALAATERVILDTVTAVLVSGASPAVIFSDANADNALTAGERMVILGTGNNDCQALGAVGAVGVTPRVKAAGAGQIDIAGSGRIVKG